MILFNPTALTRQLDEKDRESKPLHQKLQVATAEDPAKSQQCGESGAALDGEHDPFGEAGQNCSICAAETRFNTHFAFPCRHAACEKCWHTWLKDQSTCMWCNAKVQSLSRALLEP